MNLTLLVLVAVTAWFLARVWLVRLPSETRRQSTRERTRESLRFLTMIAAYIFLQAVVFPSFGART